MSGTWAQLRALVGLRWTMVRSRRVRMGLLLLAATVPLLVALAVTAGRLAPHTRSFNAAILMPTALLVYAILTVVGPLAAGGGNELFSADELVPHPIRPATVFTASLLLVPLNIAWVGQTTALLSLTGYVVHSGHGLPAAIGLTVVFVVAATTVGQAAAWWIAGVRMTRWGRRAAWALAGAAAAGAVAALHLGLTVVLDRSPTKPIVVAMLQGAEGRYPRWVATLAILGALGVVGGIIGVRAVAYLTRRSPTVVAARATQARPRRRGARSAAAQLRRTDRASVWRSPALRRGIGVMALLPGAAAAASRVDWTAIALTGGLVTAGAGLLFAVNMFCLDGAGSLWLASTPLDPMLQLRAKTRVATEVCASCGAIAVVAAATRATQPVTVAAVATAVCSVVACTAVVVAACVRSSVLRPHRADLRGPRDTPAPPGAMAVHSARLAVQTTLVALTISGVGATGRPAAPVLVAVSVVAWALRSTTRSARSYRNATIRSNVVVTVAAG